jgi:hypothetical protein
MGHGSSSATLIRLDQNDSFYFTGEIVSGKVGLNIMQGTVETDAIFITLTGEIGFTTTVTVSNGKGLRTTRTEYHHTPFYSPAITFAQPECGQKELVFEQGYYWWPFQFQLPQYLPPTTNKPLDYPHLRYYLQVMFDTSGYQLNRGGAKRLTIYPRVNLLQNPQCLQTTTIANQNSKDIILKCTSNKSGYVPGELIKVTLKIKNTRNILIKHIDVTMLQSCHIGETKHRLKIFETTLPTILNLRDQNIKENFSILIPSIPIPPSYQFQGGLRKIVSVNIWYILRFTVKAEGMSTNFNVDIPITIGTDPKPDLNQQQTLYPVIMSYSSNPEQQMFNDHDLPPDYDSVAKIL